MTKIAIVRIRGPVNNIPKIEYALKLLNLDKPNKCTLRDDTPALAGTLKIIRPYVTWGEADEDVIKLFVNEKSISLCPPKGGYGRKGVKISFAQKGAYGPRKEKINDLIKRMTHGSS